jgi:hypothetical protein
MAYYIFLKSLKILDEFRKNPHIKIPPKSPCTIFKSFANSKNPILFQKEFPLAFGPIGPASSRPTQPFGPPGLLLPPPALRQSTQNAITDRPHAAPDQLH